MTSMGAKDGIVPTQLRAHAGGDCLLPHVGVASAVNEPARMAAGELFLAGAYQLHRAIEETQVRCHTCRAEPPAFIARLPPSIGMSAPVIHFEESDARKTQRDLGVLQPGKAARGDSVQVLLTQPGPPRPVRC